MVFRDNDFNVKLSLFTPVNVALGEIACFDVEVKPVSADTDPSNNDKQYCFEIVNSYDPNDKQVYPQGECTPNYTLLNDKLTYTVRFQNTGTAEAINVLILDSLPNALQPTDLEYVTALYMSPIIEVENNQVMRIKFPNINLPDSTSNPDASIGYVVFKTKAKLGVGKLLATFFDMPHLPTVSNLK